jgi:hypothetical protein
VAGFTFIRNAVKYDYPVVESIRSMLPLCAELIVSIGRSEDETESLIQSIGSAKIRIVHSEWDDSLRIGGKVLALETDKAFAHVPKDADWCIYLQGDEVIHEKYYPEILEKMEKYLPDRDVEGLLFNYLHFYGSYNYLGDSRKWYSHEIRIIRNDPEIRSYSDAQGFRKNGRKLRVKSIDAFIYHYGWVKHPHQQWQKVGDFQRLWNESEPNLNPIPKTEGKGFDYSGIDSLKPFTGSHPAVMEDRIKRKNWILDLDATRKNFSFKDRILYWIEKKSGRRLFEYRNYTRI